MRLIQHGSRDLVRYDGAAATSSYQSAGAAAGPLFLGSVRFQQFHDIIVAVAGSYRDGRHAILNPFTYAREIASLCLQGKLGFHFEE